MKKVLIILIVIIIGIFSYTQLQLNSKQEKEDLKVQEALKNEAEVFIKAKEQLLENDYEYDERLKEAEIELNSSTTPEEAAKATDKFYEIIVDLDIDEGIFAPIEDSYRKAVIGRESFK